MVECETLAFVHGERPSRFDRVLRKSAQHGFVDFLFFLVVAILHVFPRFHLQFVDVAVFQFHFYEIGSQVIHLAQCAVHPAVFFIVADKYHLRPLLEHEFFVGG